MKKLSFKIFTFLFVAITAIEVQAQEIKFPESFRSDTSLFKGMKIAEIPTQVQTKYGIYNNPGIITDAPKTKGLLMAGKIPNVKSIYFEIYEDTVEAKMDCGFEIAQFSSEVDLNKILPGLDKKNRGVAFLTLKNYLIIVYSDGYKNFGERIDDMIKYFQQKLGAKLFQDRRKEVEVAVTENYVSNLPPPLPPEREGNYTHIRIEDLDKRIANYDGLAYMRTKKRQKLAPGKYRASSTAPVFESLVFTLDQDSLLHGDYEYHYAEDYSKSPSKESKLTYDHGVLNSEIVYEKGELLGSSTYSTSVVREGKDYLITIKTAIKNPNGRDKEIVTVFRNRKPVSKITTRLGVSVIKKDFEKNTLERYNNKGQLTKLEKPGLTEEYDNTGKVIYKDIWDNGSRKVFRNGKLRRKEIRVKDKEQYLVTEYDENGEVMKEWLEGNEKHAVIANPDEYEEKLTEALLAYYKKKVK